jgi:hypothetical protein
MLKTIFSYVKAAWDYLNGHKTNIGGFIAAVYTILLEFNVVTENPRIVTIITVVFGVGVTHKAVKFIDETK